MNEEAKTDLWNKVNELMIDAHREAMDKLETLILSGSGIVDDHANNGNNWITPREYVIAFARDLERQHAPRPDYASAKGHKARVKNYYELMG